MDNATIELSILDAIFTDIATNKQSLAASLNVEVSEVERALERMKRKSHVVFDKDKKVWSLTNQGSAVLAHDLKSPRHVGSSQESVPTNEEVVPSGQQVAAEAAQTNESETTMTTDTTKIDAAINAAKARKAKKSPSSASTTTASESTESSTETKATKPRLSDEEKKAR